MALSKKNKNNYNNSKTRKSRIKEHIPDEERAIICKNFATFDTFEDKIEEKFRKAGIDFLSTSYNLEAKILKDLRKAVSPSQILPQNDFYSYVNDRWMKEFNIEQELGYLAQVDNFRLIQDKVYKELLQIMKEYIATHNDPRAKAMNTLHRSLLLLDSAEQSMVHAEDSLKKIDGFLKDPKGLWKLLGYINQNEMINTGSPFGWSINPDDKNPTRYSCFIEPAKLPLVDIMVYFEDGTNDKYKKEYRKQYINYLQNIFVNAFGENHTFNVQAIYDIEVKLFNAMACDTIKHEDPDNYNVITTKEAYEKYGFDWYQLSKEIGFKNPPDSFIITSKNYLKCCTDMLKKEWNTPEWRTYWIYLFIKQQQRFNKKGRLIYFDFFGKFEKGLTTPISDELFPIFGVAIAFNSFLQNAYIDKYENKKYVNYVKTMAEDFRTIFLRVIQRNKWLQPRTKVKALEKLQKFHIMIGSRKIKDDDIILDYSETDAWTNMTKILQVRHNIAIYLLDKPVQPDIAVVDWSLEPPKFTGTQSFIVNAFYTPTKNSIHIPCAYLQPPFVDLNERGIEYNLAHVGFTIGHEMSHSLDDWGSKYDADGKLSNWWTEKDKKTFEKIKQNIIKEYEVFAARDGIKYDATISIGENLADIAGLTLCREYLKDFQLKNEDILPIQSLSFQAFFIYFAVQYRQKISKKSMIAHLRSDPHPLDKYRCNVPLTRSPTFRALFNVKKGDGMWWPSTNRVWEG